MKIFYLPSAIVIAFLITFCKSDTKKLDERDERTQPTPTATSKRENLNVSILLDLSDRINPAKSPGLGVQIVERDLGYIKSISEAFQEHLNGNKIITTNDNIQVFFEPEPMNAEINSLAQEMKLKFTKHNITTEGVNKIIPTFKKATSRIYELALKDEHFVGSDIWTFFKNKVHDYCILPKHRNILIILTDGYMLHVDNQKKIDNQTTYLNTKLIDLAKLNNSKYMETMEERKFGFIRATESLENLEVMVLGINPEKGRNFEDEIIKKYWADWFVRMGVKRHYIKGADLPNNLEPVIKKIISNK